MGMFDRRIEKRAREIAAQGSSGAGLGGIPRYELTGLLGSQVDGAEELRRLRPAPENATSASSIAARCIDLFVQSAASRPLVVTTGAGEPVDHYLENLFNKTPNASQSAVLFRTAVWQRAAVHGQVFIILDRGKSRVGEPTSAVIHYGAVKVILTDPTPKEPHGSVLAYKVAVGDETVTLAPSEVLWLRFPDPGEPWKARAPLTAALDAIGLSKAARGWQAGQLANGANPTGIVYVGQPASDEDYDITREEIEAALTGPSAAGRIATVGGPVAPQFIRTSFSAAEVGYLDTLNAAGDDIALALGVPLDLVGGQRTYANVETSWRIFWEGTVLPRMGIFASEISRQLLAGTDLDAEFDTSDVSALQDSRDSLVTRTTLAAEADLLTVDEAREALGYEPLPDGKGTLTLTAFRASSTPAAPAMRAVEPTVEHRATEATQEALEAPLAGVGAQVRGMAADAANSALDRLEASMKRAVVRLAEAQKRDALKRLNRGKRDATAPDLSAVFNADLWAERAYEYLLPAIAAAMDEGASSTASALGAKINIDRLLVDAADARALILVDQVNATTAKVLSDRLAAAALIEPLTVKQFADVLETTFADLGTWRAETIARTEMVGSLNYGNREAAVASGVTTARVWTATNDARTRASHADLDGYQTVGMDDPYPNGLLHPGDPSGDPGETVNCRCVEQYVTNLDGSA